MGGFGSGKGARCPRKRRQRLYVTEVPSISHKWVNTQHIDLNNPIGRIDLANKTLYFKMRTHILNGGGVWHSFTCSCGRSPRTLYFHNGQFACQRCHKLAYRCENYGKTDRAIRQKWKYVHKLGSEDDAPLRPKWMKGHAFEKSCEKIDYYHQLAYDRFFLTSGVY